MATASTRLFDMAQAVDDLVGLKRQQLVDLERLTYRQGIEPGPDLAFAGIRIAVERAAGAAALLRELVPHEPEFRAWLATRCVLAAEREPAGLTASAV